MELNFDAQGLVPVVIQDWNSGEVLTLAYANAEAIDRTRETGELHLWSRSRGELWHKGATSGNVQRVRALRADCDGDALLALVEPAGPACHTGARSCFFEGETDRRATHEVLPDLERTLAQRQTERPAGSYTVTLLDDPGLAGEKVQEEAEEVVRAVRLDILHEFGDRLVKKSTVDEIKQCIQDSLYELVPDWDEVLENINGPGVLELS